VSATRRHRACACEHKALACDTSPWPSQFAIPPSRPRSASPEGCRAPRLAPRLHRRSAARSFSLWAPPPLQPALALLTEASRSQTPPCFLPPPSSASTERRRARSSPWAARCGAPQRLSRDVPAPPCRVECGAPIRSTATAVSAPERRRCRARSAMPAKASGSSASHLCSLFFTSLLFQGL
jgi:hypothetical protein